MMIEDLDKDVSAPKKELPDGYHKKAGISDVLRKYNEDPDRDTHLAELSALIKKKTAARKAFDAMDAALKPPLFSEISSESLKQMTQETKITVMIGDTNPQEMTIYLSAPTKADLKSAESAHDMSQTKRHKLLRKAMEAKNSWLVAYMCTVRREKDSDLTWFNPNNCFYHEWSSDRTFIAIACRDSSVPVVALMLQTDGIDINSNNGDYGDALWAAVNNEDQEQSFGIIKMLCLYDNLKISNDDIKYAKTKTMRDLLTQTRDSRPPAAEEIEAAAKALPESEKTDATTTVSEDGAVWKKMDNASICKLTADDSGFRLRKIFNFKSATVSESHEYLDSDGSVKTATPPTITRFGGQGSRREIEEAQTRLKQLNAIKPTAKTVG